MIFKNVAAGTYEIVVDHAGGVGTDQDYGLAWWTGNQIPGDFDHDGDVDSMDLNKWKGDFGPGGGSDADGDGDSDGNDFLVWQKNQGTGVPATPANVPVPEPAAWMLATVGVTLLLRRRAGRHCS